MGVKNPKNFADVINGWLLTLHSLSPLLFQVPPTDKTKMTLLKYHERRGGIPASKTSSKGQMTSPLVTLISILE